MVVGTNFGQRHHPGWTANLLARPDASIEVGPKRLPVTGELADQATWGAFVAPIRGAIYLGLRELPDPLRPQEAAHVPAAPGPVRLSNCQPYLTPRP